MGVTDPLALWLNNLTQRREGETDEEHLDRIRSSLTMELDEDI